MRSSCSDETGLISAVESAISQRSSVWAVARDTGIPRSTLTSRLKGETPFLLGEVEVIARVLDVPVISLFPEAPVEGVTAS